VTEQPVSILAPPPFGVKLEDQIVVRDGAELLSTYPFDAKLLS
jgi:hypothetical protein